MVNKVQKKMLFLGCLFLMFILMILVTGRSMRAAPSQQDNQLKTLNTGWYYLKDGRKTEVELPAVLKAEPGGILELKNDRLTEKDSFSTILTKGARYGLRITVNGEEVYSYQEYGFKRNLQMLRKLECRAALPKITENSELILRFQVPDSGVCEIQPVYEGSSEAVLRYQLINAAPVLGIVLVMLMFSVLAMGIYSYLRYKQIPEKRFVSVGMFLFLCGIWCVTDSSLVQYMSGYSPAVNEISFYAFMLMSVPMIMFVQKTEGMKKYRSISVLISLFYLNVILQSVCTYLFGTDMIDMLFVTHILLAAGCILIGRLLYKEYKAVKSRQVRSILVAFGVLAVFGVFALVLYWGLGITEYDLIFETGILIFVAILLWGLCVTMVDNMKFRTEAMVYKKLAQEDQMTGMKNRFAFEKVMEDLERGNCEWENAVLVFMDLNHLKRTNDLYGHGAGDELLIAAAQCIQKAYGSMGYCFRLGGDEFCAIIPGEGQPEAELSCKLDEVIQEYNRANRFVLSIARGFSRLKDEQGRRKSISDWKFQADQEMYRNKGWYKKEAQKEGNRYEL